MASDLLSLPDPLQSWIAEHMPELASARRVRLNARRRIPFSWIPGNATVSGITLWNRIYLRDHFFPINVRDRRTVELIFHELIHVLQFRRNPLLFPVKYLAHHFMYGYENNPAEVEARRVAAQLSADYFG
jgi:hypothetical protein